MSLENKLKQRRRRRKFRVRNALRGSSMDGQGAKLRVSVFRSLKQIYAQIIDDSAHKTVAAFSSKHLKDAKGDKKAIAKQVGLELGKLAKSQSIENVFFDRGSCLYHGRVKALAEGLREGGLKF